MKPIKTLLALSVLGVAGAGAFIGFGVYNVAADDPHWPMTYRLMETLRERSVETRAASIEVPALDDAALIRRGAGNYHSMCAGCHLNPGASDTELSLGLYPAPPNWLALGAVDPREAFWVVKHGIKMSGMPAWGKSMEDRHIWGMVALMQQFPRMTAAQYRDLVAASPGHSHGGGETKVSGDSHDAGAADVTHAASRSSFEPVDDPMGSATAAGADPAPHDNDKPGHQH